MRDVRRGGAQMQRDSRPPQTAGERETDANLQLVEALNQIRQERNMSTKELADQAARHRTAISRLFHARRPNPTIGTFSVLLKALHFTAEIRLRPAEGKEPPIRIRVEDSPPAGA